MGTVAVGCKEAIGLGRGRVWLDGRLCWNRRRRSRTDFSAFAIQAWRRSIGRRRHDAVFMRNDVAKPECSQRAGNDRNADDGCRLDDHTNNIKRDRAGDATESHACARDVGLFNRDGNIDVVGIVDLGTSRWSGGAVDRASNRGRHSGCDGRDQSSISARSNVNLSQHVAFFAVIGQVQSTLLLFNRNT